MNPTVDGVYDEGYLELGGVTNPQMKVNIFLKRIGSKLIKYYNAFLVINQVSLLEMHLNCF